MKLFNSFTKLAFCLIAGGFLLSSCVDETVDLENMSDNMRVGGTLATPIGESTVTIQDLLNHYSDNLGGGWSANTDNGVLNLIYKDSLMYDLTDTFKLKTFGIIEKTLVTGDYMAADFGGNTSIPIPTKTYSLGKTLNSYNFNSINDIPSEKVIDSIRFSSAILAIEATSTYNFPSGSMKIDITLPDEFQNADGSPITTSLNLAGLNSVSQTTMSNFVVKILKNTSTSYPITVTMKAGSPNQNIPNNATINIKVSLKNPQFVAFGVFNYPHLLNTRQAGFNLDIYKSIPDGILMPVNPQVQFDLSSNVGVPMQFNMNYIRTQTIDSIQKVNASFNGSISKAFVFNKATAYPQMHDTSYVFDNTTANGQTDKLFEIRAEKIRTQFGIGTGSASNEYVPSDSKMKVGIKATLPFWMKENTNLTYIDTLENIDKDIKDVVDDDHITRAALVLKVANNLPIKFLLTLDLIDANGNIINSTNAHQYTITSAPVDANGLVTATNNLEIKVLYDTNTINELRQAKHLRYTIKAEGFDSSKKIKVSGNDWLKIKAGAYAIGGVSISSK